MMTIDRRLLKKLDAGREYRMIRVENLEIRTEDSDDGSMIVEGYATTFNTPYELIKLPGYTVYEQIDARAFDECDMTDVIMQYDHMGRVFTRTGNGTLKLSIDKHGLKIRAELSGTEIGRQLYQEIRGGYTTKMSIGFVVDKDSRTVTEDHETGAIEVLRTITSIRKLYDVSAVSTPANDTTEISARSYADGVIGAITEERRKVARDKLALRLKIMEANNVSHS